MHTLYSKIARFWAVIFLIVGLLFLILPFKVLEFLNALGHGLGWAGTMTGAPATLWYILALSLMGIITVCAWSSAKWPDHSETYYALLTAKIISTIGFIFLAVSMGGVWIVAAVGDGFVALTLWGSRMLGKQEE